LGQTAKRWNLYVLVDIASPSALVSCYFPFWELVLLMIGMCAESVVARN